MEEAVEAVDVADASNLCLSQKRSNRKKPTASPVTRNLLLDSGYQSQQDLTGTSMTSLELFDPVEKSSGLHALARGRADISFSISTPLSGTYLHR